MRAMGWLIAAVWLAVGSAGFPAAFFAIGINAPQEVVCRGIREAGSIFTDGVRQNAA